MTTAPTSATMEATAPTSIRMNFSNKQRQALESPVCVSEVAACFDAIATAMHKSLLRLTGGVLAASSEKMYALITEEYGLRARLGILSSDAENRVVSGVNVTQHELVQILTDAAQFVSHSQSIDKIASITNGAAALCVSIFPGKHETVNFLISRLRADISA
jgi:hypothetical protein